MTRDQLPPVGTIIRSTKTDRVMWQPPNRFKVVSRYYRRRRWWLSCVKQFHSGKWGTKRYRISKFELITQ